MANNKNDGIGIKLRMSSINKYAKFCWIFLYKKIIVKKNKTGAE